MKFTLKDNCYLKRLEQPHIYDTVADELYLLDEESFNRVSALCEGQDDPEAAELLDEAGLLQLEPRGNAIYVDGRSDDPSLRYLEVQITTRCDKVCRHCYLGNPRDSDMEPVDFSTILEEFSRMQGLKVMVSGGEPSCHPRFDEIIRILPGFPLRSVLITHGEWIGPKEAELLGRYFHQVQVSLDGLEPGHDALRGDGSFSVVVSGIRALRETGVSVSVGTMVHRQNLNEFETMSDMLKNLDVQEWDIDVPCPVGRWGSERTASKMLKIMSEKLRHAYGGSFHGGSAGLACGSHLMTVGPGGEAAKCGFYMDSPAGKVSDGLGNSWRTIKHVLLSELQCQCEQLNECSGGCRFRAEVLEGSDLAPDIVQCYARGVK